MTQGLSKAGDLLFLVTKINSCGVSLQQEDSKTESFEIAAEWLDLFIKSQFSSSNHCKNAMVFKAGLIAFPLTLGRFSYTIFETERKS